VTVDRAFRRALALALSFALISGSLSPSALAQVRPLAPEEPLPAGPLTAVPVEDAATGLDALPQAPAENPLYLSPLEPLSALPRERTAARSESLRRELGTALHGGEGGVSRARETMDRFFERAAPLRAAPEVEGGEALTAPQGIGSRSSASTSGSSDPWTELASILGFETSNAPAWRRSTLDALRNDPALPIGDALAAALKAAYPGNPLAGEAGKELFAGRPATIVNGKVYAVQLIDGRVYVGTLDGAYVGQGGTWRRIAGLPPTYSIAKLSGKIYAATAEGIFVEQNGTWKMDSPRTASTLGEVGGRPFAYTSQGPFVKLWGKWRRAFGWPAYIQHVVRADGKTYGFDTSGGYKGIKLFRWTWLGW
jgi:hypothetical protein